jgi:hypothetical protein
VIYFRRKYGVIPNFPNFPLLSRCKCLNFCGIIKSHALQTHFSEVRVTNANQLHSIKANYPTAPAGRNLSRKEQFSPPTKPRRGGIRCANLPRCKRLKSLWERFHALKTHLSEVRVTNANQLGRVFTELCQYLIFKFINLNSVTKCNQQFRQN